MNILKAAVAAVCFGMVTMWSTADIAGAQAVESGLPERSKEELAALWRNYTPLWAADPNPFVQTPNANAPYKAGKLKQDYMQGGVAMANMYRYASGLPGHLLFDEALVNQAQHGAVLNAAHEEIDHTPVKPADMPEAFYNLGYESASSSNLASLTKGYIKENILARTVKMYMSDSDLGNIAHVDHRRWIQLDSRASEQATVTAQAVQFTGQALMLGSGEPRAGVAVKVFRADPSSGVVDSKPLLKLETDMKGFFYISGLGDGTYQIRLGNDDVISDLNYQLTIKNGTADKNKGQFDLDVVQLSGKIVHANGSPAAGAYVKYGNPGQGLYTADTDETGTYRIADLKTNEANTLYFYANQGYSVYEKVSATWDFVYKGGRMIAPDAVVNGENVQLAQLSVSFTDIAGHWAEAAIKEASSSQIASGYPDGTFRPDRIISEAEFITLLFRVYDVKLSPEQTDTHWSHSAYQYAYKLQYPVTKESEGKQDESINRGRVAEIIAGADGLNYVGNDAIQYVLAKGYSSGKTARSIEGYQGRDSLTRAEALQFLLNMKSKGLQELKVRPKAESARSLLPSLQD